MSSPPVLRSAEVGRRQVQVVALRDHGLYAAILGVTAFWEVLSVDVRANEEESRSHDPRSSVMTDRLETNKKNGTSFHDPVGCNAIPSAF